jgi:hypothetical protein
MTAGALRGSADTWGSGGIAPHTHGILNGGEWVSFTPPAALTIGWEAPADLALATQSG